jgi:Na+/H+ antiporter NhaD/arsenite permease-like protein
MTAYSLYWALILTFADIYRIMILTATILFIIGYLLIIFEHKIKIDKAVSAILTGVVLWVLIAMNADHTDPADDLNLVHVLGDISAILFFLLGAMTIVEVVDLHEGFKLFSSWVKTNKKFTLLLLVCFISFFLSAALDNLTTTIVMISIIRKIIEDQEDRFWFVSCIVIAANSGGAWSPIGDITTTMLWIDNKVSSLHLVQYLLIPSLISLIVPLIIISQNKRFKNQAINFKFQNSYMHSSAKFYLFLGISLLVMVPVFKGITHLPPFMGMMGALGIIWLVSEIDHPFLQPTSTDHPKPTIQHALSRIEIPSILFFFGILLAISALEHIGQLNQLGIFLDSHVDNVSMIAFVLGLFSAVIDNVPMVAGAIGMYDFPMDHSFWHELAFAAGTGGSILIIGSAAGVTAMGLEKISYPWYFKRISLLAFIGYLAGWAYIYFVQ